MKPTKPAKAFAILITKPRIRFDIIYIMRILGGGLVLSNY